MAVAIGYGWFIRPAVMAGSPEASIDNIVMASAAGFILGQCAAFASKWIIERFHPNLALSLIGLRKLIAAKLFGASVLVGFYDRPIAIMAAATAAGALYSLKTMITDERFRLNDLHGQRHQ